MNHSYNKPAKSHRKKRNKQMRRMVLVFMLLVVIGLAAALCWFVAHSLLKVATTGDKPVSSQSASTTLATTTTTFPTIAASASVTTPHIVLYDNTHSALLYSSKADEKCYPASLTKLLTATLATEYCGEDEVFTVGSELSFVKPESSVAGLKQGYKMNRQMILEALLLPSGNDAAYTIAAHVGRKVSGNASLSDIEAIRKFIDLMNNEAQKIGAVNSHFSNPDGFFDENHYTTASDMLLISKNALKYSNIRQVVDLPSASFNILSGQKVAWTNTNDLINPKSSYYFNGAEGMKTGSTDESGYCVVASAKRNGVELIAVIMGGASSDARWRDAVSILKDGFAAENSAAVTAAAQ